MNRYIMGWLCLRSELNHADIKIEVFFINMRLKYETSRSLLKYSMMFKVSKKCKFKSHFFSVAYRSQKSSDLSHSHSSSWHHGLGEPCVYKNSIFSLAQLKEYNPWWKYKPCTTIPVFNSTSCEDWTAVEDSSWWGFKAYNSPFCIRGAVIGFLKNYP